MPFKLNSRPEPGVLCFIMIGVWALLAFWSASNGAVQDLEWDLVMSLRIPRILLATFAGAGLAIAGLALQALFTNPLCEPYILGISSGAAAGAVIGESFEFFAGTGGALGLMGMMLMAFVGSLAFSMVIWGLSFFKSMTNATILLVGVALGFLGTSILAVWIALNDPNGLQGALIWLFGDLSRASLGLSITVGVIVAASYFYLYRIRGQLDGLLLGEEGAISVGVSVDRLRRGLILWISLLVGCLVSVCGSIGFVGLIVPHLARLMVGSLHRAALPVSACLGAVLLTVADQLARTIAPPVELPVGVITAFIGAPFFLWIVLRGRMRWS